MNVVIPPLIGVTGFTEPSQVSLLRKIFRDQLPLNSKRKLHVGVMISRKTAYGEPTKYKYVYAKREDIADLFTDSPFTYRVLHYADFRTTNPENVLKHLIQATSFGGPNMQALQLDMNWPDPSAIAEFRKQRPGLAIILQVNPKPYNERLPAEIAMLMVKIANYAECIDGVLLDESIGQGIPMNAERLLQFAKAVHTRFPRLHITVAGGLGPDTLDVLEPIIQTFPNISIDAEGALHFDGLASNPINWGLAAAYINRAVSMLAVEPTMVGV